MMPTSTAGPYPDRQGAGKIIGLYGNFGIGNFGNDASLEAMLRLLRRALPAAELTCVCTVPERVAADFGLPTVDSNCPPLQGPRAEFLNRFLLKLPRRVYAWFHALRHVRKLDALVIPGTGMLDDLGTGPGGQPYRLFRWCLAARLAGVPVAFVSVGAGPIMNPLSRVLMKSAARMAHYRSFRDAMSRDYMRSIGLDTKADHVYPDLAFSLSHGPTSECRAGKAGPLTIAVGVMAYGGWKGEAAETSTLYKMYVEKLVAFLRWLLAAGHHVRLVIGEDSDRKAVDEVMLRLKSGDAEGGAERVVAETGRSLHDVLNQFADADVVVATRYHNVVAALMLNKPTLSISYASKNDVLLAEAGLAAYCQRIERLDLDRLKQQLAALVEGRKSYSGAVASTVAEYAERLTEQETVLSRALAVEGA